MLNRFHVKHIMVDTKCTWKGELQNQQNKCFYLILTFETKTLADYDGNLNNRLIGFSAQKHLLTYADWSGIQMAKVCFCCCMFGDLIFCFVRMMCCDVFRSVAF